MKKPICLFLIFFSFSLPAQLVEKVQAQVGEEMISFIDLKNFKKQLSWGWITSSLLDQPAFKKSLLLKNQKKLLDFMITRNMLSQLTETEKLEGISEKKVEQILHRLKGSSSHKKFSIQLQSAGLNLKTLRKEILKDLKIDLLLKQFVVSKITVSEQDIESYYFNKYNRPLFNSFEYEFVSVQFSEKEKPAVLKNLGRSVPEDLEEMASTLGLEHKSLKLKEGEIQQQFKKELRRLSVSQISPLLIVGNIYYILQLKWKYPLINPQEQKRKVQIEKILYKENLAKEMKIWIEEKRAGFSIVQHSL